MFTQDPLPLLERIKKVGPFEIHVVRHVLYDLQLWNHRTKRRIPSSIFTCGSYPSSFRALLTSANVSGTSPGPGGNFVEGRTGATFGVLASYQSSLEFDLSYTTFGGAGRYNELGDRDFLAATIKYSF